MKIRSKNGGPWMVEVVDLGTRGSWYRVNHFGFFVRLTGSVEELADMGIDLADMEEVE